MKKKHFREVQAVNKRRKVKKDKIMKRNVKANLMAVLEQDDLKSKAILNLIIFIC